MSGALGGGAARAPCYAATMADHVRAASGRLVLELLEGLGVCVLTVLLWGRGRTQAPAEGCPLGVDEMWGHVWP
jgi:hypothetical protein